MTISKPREGLIAAQFSFCLDFEVQAHLKAKSLGAWYSGAHFWFMALDTTECLKCCENTSIVMARHMRKRSSIGGNYEGTSELAYNDACKDANRA